MPLAFSGWEEVVETLFSITFWINFETSEYGVSTKVEYPIFTFSPLVMWKPLANDFVSLIDFYLPEKLGLFLIYKQSEYIFIFQYHQHVIESIQS